MSADIEKINKTITKYESIAETANQINQLKNTLNELKPIQSQLENFDIEQISRFRRAQNQTYRKL